MTIWAASTRVLAQPRPEDTTADFRPVQLSPRILALRRRVLSGDRDALHDFWRETERVGTPLLEPVKGSSSELIATFLWRGGPDTKSVRLMAPLERVPRMPDLPLTRLLNTDVWYKSWQLRDDLRFSYRFLVNAKPGQDYQQQAVVDPLNLQQIELAFDEGQPTIRFSIAAMPRGLEPTWITKQPGILTGRVERCEFKSTILGNARAIWVYTPPNYEQVKSPYPLLVLFDGFAYLNWIPVPTILDNLIHAGRLWPTVAVLVGNAVGSRVKELKYNSAFTNFVAKELTPWVREHWNVTSDPEKTIIGGYSLGGLAAAFVALQHPELFGNLLAQSGSFQDGNKDVKWEWLSGQYEAVPKLALRFFLEAGRLEDASSEGPTLLAANRHLVSVLRQKGYSIAYEEVGGTHEPVHWRGEFGEALTSIPK